MILVGRASDSNIVELRLIHCLLNHNWKVLIHYISRSQNTVANHMAKCAAATFTGIQWFGESPQSVRGLVEEDYLGSLRN
ncbi:hypothetical protein Gogos_016255 [Gossypium gossypioides]|uniref:RNase H type-1 domain-containing protein n=1 Tax=Gossypium gossypioides TaxID=34282 RepID=A0A7J9B735_GOSGO|nr:hypothetical protein [Gossypium gossypioides]